MKLSNFPINTDKKLETLGSWSACGHYYHPEHIKAVVAAWHAKRPLLVKGEPGVGKSQLASAVAQALGWQFISVAIQPRTEYQDLLWEFDAVARLARAQILGALGEVETVKENGIPESLKRERFIIPGQLWWAIRPQSAEAQKGEAEQSLSPYLVKSPKKDNVVLLIDEIDKADANLPNGLLELLGNGDISLPVSVDEQEQPRWPLTIITSNDERRLPPAFLRRCLVLNLELPQPGEALEAYLCLFAQAHAKAKVDTIGSVPEEIVLKTAKVLSMLRLRTAEGERKPGAAEFLDLLRVLGGLGGTLKEMEENIDDLSDIVLFKDRQG